MKLSYDTIRKVIEPHLDKGWEYCHNYGEPGYTFSDDTTPLVVLGDYWCRCDKLNDSKLHSLMNHHPKVWAQMEAQGVAFEWYDEWTIDYDNDKAYRTSGDSYQWQSSIVLSDDCEWITPDDDLSTWIEWASDDASRCLPSRVWSSGDLIGAGFVQWNENYGQYESGWHPGQNDDPTKVTAAIRRELDNVEVVFLLDETSQFYIGFTAWTRPIDVEDDED